MLWIDHPDCKQGRGLGVWLPGYSKGVPSAQIRKSYGVKESATKVAGTVKKTN